MTAASLPDWFQGIGALIAVPVSLWALWQGRKNEAEIVKLTKADSHVISGLACVGGRGGDGMYAGQGGGAGDVLSTTFRAEYLPDKLHFRIGNGGIGGLPGHDGMDGGDTYVEELGLRAKGGKGGDAGSPPEVGFQRQAEILTNKPIYCNRYAYWPDGHSLRLAFGSETQNVKAMQGHVESCIALPWDLVVQLRDHLSTLSSPTSDTHPS